MSSPLFVLRDSRASETRGRVKITPREKGETRWRERWVIFTRPWGLLVVYKAVVIPMHETRLNKANSEH